MAFLSSIFKHVMGIIAMASEDFNKHIPLADRNVDTMSTLRIDRRKKAFAATLSVCRCTRRRIIGQCLQPAWAACAGRRDVGHRALSVPRPQSCAPLAPGAGPTGGFGAALRTLRQSHTVPLRSGGGAAVVGAPSANVLVLTTAVAPTAAHP